MYNLSDILGILEKLPTFNKASYFPTNAVAAEPGTLPGAPLGSQFGETDIAQAADSDLPPEILAILADPGDEKLSKPLP